MSDIDLKHVRDRLRSLGETLTDTASYLDLYFDKHGDILDPAEDVEDMLISLKNTIENLQEVQWCVSEHRLVLEKLLRRLRDKYPDVQV